MHIKLLKKTIFTILALFFFFESLIIFSGELHFRKALGSQKNFEDIEKEFQKSFFLNPQPDYYLVFAGFLLENQQKEKQAKFILEKLVNLEKKNYKAYNLLGKIYFSEKDFEKAEINFKKAIEADPLNHPLLYFDLAELYLNQKKYEEGKNLLIKILSFYPEKVVLEQYNHFQGLIDFPSQISACRELLDLIYQL